MKVFEQRIATWGGLVVSLGAFVMATLAFLYAYRLDRDRFVHPNEAPVGVTWEKDRVVGGVNTIPVQYTDLLTFSNHTKSPLTNVEVVVLNRTEQEERTVKVGRLEPGQACRLDGFKLFSLKKCGPGELTPRHVVVVRCDGYAEKRIPGDKLGKERSLYDVAKEENQENKADKDYWPKVWAWEDGLQRRGIEPTKEMYEEWFRQRQLERDRQKKG